MLEKNCNMKPYKLSFIAMGWGKISTRLLCKHESDKKCRATVL